MDDVAHLRELLEVRVGEMATGDWHTITQEAIGMFAEATGDHQWIHVDADRAADGPFGATIAHGFMTLALIPGIGPRFEVPEARMIINYGVNRVRFLSPVPVGSRVRVVTELVGVTERRSGLLLAEQVTVELENSSRPACIAETLVLLVL